PPAAPVRELKALPAGAEIRGSLDGMDGASAYGWAMLPADPSHRLRVEIWDRDRLVAIGDAGLPRDDLIAGRVGDGYCAFSIRLPQSLYDGEEHAISARVAGVATPLARSPIVWRPASLAV